MKNIRRNICIKLALLEIAVLVIMNFLVPILSNYPPNSENPEFQSQIEPISHTMQYVSLGSLGVTLYIAFISISLNKVFKFLKSENKNVSIKEIKEIREKCFAFNKQIVWVQIAALIIVLFILFFSMNLDLHLIFKFLLIYFSFFTAAAIISGIITRKDIDKVLELTYKINNESTTISKPTKFSNELLYNLLPFFLVVVITICLLGYSKTSETIGEENYYFYKLSMLDLPSENVSRESMLSYLDTIKLKSDSDYYFMITPSHTYFSNEDGYVSEFFLKYANMYLEEMNGRVYEYYGVEEEAYAQKVKLSNGEEALIGFKYSTTSNSLITYFFTIAIIATIAYIFILVIWSKNVSKNIIEVSNNLFDISKQKNISNINNLPITSTNEIGQLTMSFNEIQKSTKKNIETIQSSQSQLVEQERLASLGQMIGGIAHNLKTPIMSISGASEALNDLIAEFDASIGNPVVNEDDFHEIAKDMYGWVDKVKSYTEYMSDVITAVKGQAIVLGNDTEMHFTINELLKRVNILMKHELKNAVVYLNISVKIDENTTIKGDVNSLVQVINNMISNSIQAYNGEPEKNIELIVDSIDKDYVSISIKDYGPGLPKVVKDKLFKEMITTKGKNGTGLGLYMSYSNIKAHFNGDITVDSSKDGTTFNIILPL